MYRHFTLSSYIRSHIGRKHREKEWFVEQQHGEKRRGAVSTAGRLSSRATQTETIVTEEAALGNPSSRAALGLCEIAPTAYEGCRNVTTTLQH